MTSMTRVESYTCDGCGCSAPDGFEMFSTDDPRWAAWLHVENLYVSLDVCSWECLAKVAARHGAVTE